MSVINLDKRYVARYPYPLEVFTLIPPYRIRILNKCLPHDSAKHWAKRHENNAKQFLPVSPLMMPKF